MMFGPNGLRSRSGWLNLSFAMVIGLLVFGNHAAQAWESSPVPSTTLASTSRQQDDTADSSTKESVVEGPIRGPRGERPPVEYLVPATTKALVVIRDFDQLHERLLATQFGRIFEQDQLKPVVDEVRRKLEKNLTDANQQLGFTIDDIRGVRTGEVGFAVLLPNPEGHAIAAIADIEGNEEAAQKLMARVKANLVNVRNAEALPDVTEGKSKIAHFKLPLPKGEAVADHVYFTITQGFVLASDNESIIRTLVRSTEDNQPPDFVPLAGLKTFRAIQQHIRSTPDGKDDSDIRWFVEPFGLSDTFKNALPRGERHKDYANILKRQGFSAIEGMGGTVIFDNHSFDVLHRTFISAPHSAGAEAVGEERFERAARMLSMSNVKAAELAPPAWLPTSTATYFSTHWDMLKAFDSIGPLVDDIVGSEGSFARMLQGLIQDPMGPRVDLREEIFAKLEPRLMMFSDIKQPIGLNSETMMLAIPIADATVVRQAMAKIMAKEPGIVVHEVAGRTVYEKDPSKIDDVADDDLPEDVKDFQDIDIFDNPLPGDPAEEKIETEESLAGWNTYTVTDEYLLISNHLDFLSSILEHEVNADAARLAQADDYQRVATALDALVGTEASIVQFGRQDEVMRVTFELLRQGKMPESQSLMGEFLNRQLGTGEPGVLREQQIDPESLPQGENAYDELVAPYIGPSGWRCITESDGWMIVGGMLPKELAVKTETQDSDVEGAKESTADRSSNEAAGDDVSGGN